MVRIVVNINRVLGVVAISSIVIMMISTVIDVTGRYTINSPLLGTIELNRTLLVFSVLFSLAYTQSVKQHVRVEMLLSRLPQKGRVILDILCLLIAATFVGFVIYGSAIVAYEATMGNEVETGIINFPMWPGRIAIALGFIALFLQYALNIAENYRLFQRQENARR